MKTFTLVKVAPCLNTGKFSDDACRILSHVRFSRESDAWGALLDLMAEGFDACGWDVRPQIEASEPEEGEAA